MQIKNKKAFTMIELVFVIVVIGILAAVALPRFGDSADSAYITKAQATLATVRASLATERQRRILRGDITTPIDDLSDDGNGSYANNAFDHFSADGQDTPVYTLVLDYPIKACATGGTQRACWDRTSKTGYSYIFPRASIASSGGKADFALVNNRLDCADDKSEDCLIITQ